MKTRHRSKMVNLILIVFTATAGGLWWALGELFYYPVRTVLKDLDYRFQYILMPLIIGLYFSLLTIFSILACATSERIIPSIVSRDFFNTAVKPTLYRTIIVSFAVMTLTALLLQLVYEFNVTPKRTAFTIEEETIEEEVEKTVYETVGTAGFDDYYFVMDRSGSMGWNDPGNERLKLLGRIVDQLPEDRKVALISFDDEVSIDLPLQELDRQTKDTVNSIANRLSPRGGTDIVAALEVLSKSLNDDASRSGTVILISDGNSGYEEAYLDQVLSPLVKAKIPVHTVMLIPKEPTEDMTEGIALLRLIAAKTGGRQSTVDNFTDFEREVVRSVTMPVTNRKTAQVTHPKTTRVIREAEEQDDSVRSLIARREGKTESSGVYRGMHILFITAVGLLMGFLTYVVFSHGHIFIPMLINGSTGGILAGLLLEFGLQGGWAPPLIRLAACIILSTVLWMAPVLYKIFSGETGSIADIGVYNSGKSGFTGGTGEQRESKLKKEMQDADAGNSILEGKEQSATHDKGRLV
jgi:Ca-activated chloride channel family protein